MENLISKTSLLYIAKVIAAIFVVASLILWAWNNTMPLIFELPVIHFKESVSLIILALGLSFIFKSGKHPMNSIGRK